MAFVYMALKKMHLGGMITSSKMARTNRFNNDLKLHSVVINQQVQIEHIHNPQSETRP